MTETRWTTHLKRAALGGVLGFVVLAACAPGLARADDDDENSGNSIWNLERRVWNGFIRSLGLRSNDEPQIDYRERSPLVVPPSRNLPPPDTTGSVRNPAWPVDPDASRQKKAASKSADTRSWDRINEERNRNLMPHELNRPGAPANTAGGDAASVDGHSQNMRPAQLGYFGGIFGSFGFSAQRDEVGTFNSEPPRTTLTAPPVGYQTPSAAQPYGVSKRIEKSKPMRTEDIPVGTGY